MSIPDIVEILERTRTGEVCTVKDWDVRRIPRAIRSKLEKYGLQNCCDPANPVNMDDSLADTFFKAGYELALELGMLCETTERIIRVSEAELASALKFAPSELFVGTGRDGTLLKTRVPSDPYPMPFGASLGLTTSEEIWPALTEGIARQRDVDLLEGGSLITIHGHPILPATPF